MYVRTYVCMYVCVYVCECVCVGKYTYRAANFGGAATLVPLTVGS